MSARTAAAAEGLLPLQVHLRHLVGGRARSFLGQMPHERIFQACPHLVVRGRMHLQVS